MSFHELVVHREPGRDPLLGCSRSRRFFEVDETTLAAVDLLQGGATIAETRERLCEGTGEDYDVAGLVELLRGRGFVQALDGVPEPDVAGAPPTGGVLNRIPPERLRWMRHPAWLLVLAGALAAWAFTMHSGLPLPGWRDLFPEGRPGIVLVATFAGLIGFAALHELAHFLVARSYGVASRISVSHRFYMLVLQTDVTNAWTLPRRQRLAVFLAGIGLNLLLAAAFSVAAWGVARGLVPAPAAWVPALRFAAFLNTFPLAFQLFFFARTDLYFTLLALTGERNLAGDARGYLRLRSRHLVRRLLRRPHLACPMCASPVWEEEPFCVRCGAPRPIQDPNRYPFPWAKRRRLLAFGLTLVGGQVFGIALLLMVLLPMVLTYVGLGSALVGHGRTTGDLGLMAEGVLVLGVALLQVAFILTSVLGGARGRRRRPQGAVGAGPPAADR